MSTGTSHLEKQTATPQQTVLEGDEGSPTLLPSQRLRHRIKKLLKLKTNVNLKPSRLPNRSREAFSIDASASEQIFATARGATESTSAARPRTRASCDSEKNETLETVSFKLRALLPPECEMPFASARLPQMEGTRTVCATW